MLLLAVAGALSSTSSDVCAITIPPDRGVLPGSLSADRLVISPPQRVRAVKRTSKAISLIPLQGSYCMGGRTVTQLAALAPRKVAATAGQTGRAAHRPAPPPRFEAAYSLLCNLTLTGYYAICSGHAYTGVTLTGVSCGGRSGAAETANTRTKEHDRKGTELRI